MCAAAFRARLGKDYVFDFLDAPFQSDTAVGIDAFTKPSTHTWWREWTPSDIQDSCIRVVDYARKNGPYDAICCFSQGCHLVAATALHHAMESATSSIEALPFRSAIFICGGMPLPALEGLGLEVPLRAYEINRLTSALLAETNEKLKKTAATDRKHIRAGVDLWDADDERHVHDPTVRPSRFDVFGLDFRQFPPHARITIPTAHIYGAKDPKWHSSVQLAEFCDDRTEYDHKGGHDIPRSNEVSNRIADIVESVILRAERSAERMLVTKKTVRFELQPTAVQGVGGA